MTNSDYLLNLNTEQSISYADSYGRFQTQLPLLFSYPTQSGSLNPNDLYSDNSEQYLAYPAGVHQTTVTTSQLDRYGSITLTTSGSISFYVQSMEYAGDSNPAYIAGPYIVSGEGGLDDLFIATYYDDTPQNPFANSFSITTPGTYSVVFPSPLVSRAFTITHSGSSTYSISQILPRKIIQKYDIEVNSIKAYHVSSTLIDTIALQVSDSIVVGSGLIGEKSIDGGKIIDGTISGVLIANGTVTSNKVQAGTISGVLIAGSTITGDKIVAATISGSLITAGTITADRIASSTLTASQIADGTITGQKIVAGTVSGVLIADNTISASNIQANTITGDKIAAATISGSLITAGTITSTQIAVSGITAGSLAANSITADNITTRTITADKIVLSGVTADLLGPEAVTSAALASGAVISGKLAVGAVQTNNLAAGSVTAYAIAANTITGDRIAANTISGALITTGTITADNIATSTLTAAQIADGTITGQKIVAGTVSGVLITDGTISATKIQANTITGDKIAARTISGVLLTISGIKAENIEAGAITSDKISVTNLQAVSANTGSLTVNGTITAGQTKINTYGMSVGSLADPLTQAALPSLNSNVLTIVASGTSGDLQGIAMFNIAQSTTTPLASINLDGTSTLEIANNLSDNTAAVHVNFKESYTGQFRIYNGNFDMRRTPGTPPNIPTGSIRGYDSDQTTLYELSSDRISLNSTAGVGIFNVEANTGAVTITGDVAVNTNKFKVTASTGNTSVAGTLGVTSDLAVNTNKFNVTASTGDTSVAGILGVTGDLAINTNKVSITASNGNTDIRGNVTVSGSISHRDAGILSRSAGQTVNAGTSARVQLNVAGTGNILGNATTYEITVTNAGLYIVNAALGSTTTNLPWNVRQNATSFTTGTQVLPGLTFNDGRQLNTTIFYLSANDTVGLFVNNTGGSSASVTGALRVVRLT